MGLREAILGLLAKADKWSSSNINEANTKALFIEPLLHSLGWDVHDLDMVTREYRVYDNTAIDYALNVDGKPRLFVEAKPLGKSLDDKQFIAQTVNYANNEGVVWCVLTNGLQYRVYKTNEPTDMERKLFMDVDLREARDDRHADEVAGRLTYLSRDSIEAGDLDEWGERTFTDKRVKAALVGLLSNPPTQVVNLILEKLGGSHAPSQDRIEESLRRIATLLGGDTGVPAPAVLPARPQQLNISERVVQRPLDSLSSRQPSGWIPLDRLAVGAHQPPPRQLRLPDGTVRELKFWRELLIEVGRYLVRIGALTAQRCPISTSGVRFLVHTEPRHQRGNPFRAGARVGDLWLETHYSAQLTHTYTLLLVRRVGLDPGSFEVLC